MSQEVIKHDRQTYLQNKHAKFQTPQSIIDQAVLTMSGEKIASQNKIIKGEVNEVYAIKTHGGQELIVRIGQGDWARESFAKEKWVIEKCLEVGVPAPKVLSLQNLDLEDNKLTICIESKLPGVPMDEYKDWENEANKPEMGELIRKVGNILARIHSIRLQGFGNLSADGKAPYKSAWERIEHDHEIFDYDIFKAAQRRNLDERVVTRAQAILKTEWPKYPVSESRLLHRDYGVKHIIVDNGAISGIIDFQNAEAGDRVLDFGWWDYWNRDSYSLEKLMDGYTDKNLFDGDFEIRKNLWKVHLGLSILGYFDKEENLHGIEKCKKRLIEDIKLFD